MAFYEEYFPDAEKKHVQAGSDGVNVLFTGERIRLRHHFRFSGKKRFSGDVHGKLESSTDRR